jgi:hypothetical protein
MLALVGAWWLHNELLYPQGLREIQKERRSQVPLNVVIVVKDQFGQPAEGFSVTVRLWYVSWYYRIFPRLSRHWPRYTITTDKAGVARLHHLFGSVESIRFEPAKNAQYIQYFARFVGDPLEAAPGKQVDRATIAPAPPMDITSPTNTLKPVLDWPVARTTKETAYEELARWVLIDSTRDYGRYDPISTVYLAKVGSREQRFTLIAWRHGESARLNYLGSDQQSALRAEEDAADENRFTIDLNNNRFVEGRLSEGILVTVKNAKAVPALLEGERLEHQVSGEWDIIFEGQGGIELQESGRAVCYAPREGYKKKITYRIAIAKNDPADATAVFNDQERCMPLVEEAEKEVYYLCGGVSRGITRGFFVKSATPPYYGWIAVECHADEGKLRIRVIGFYNPDGSTNLWTKERYYWN